MKKLILLLLFIPLVFSCEQRMSTEELTEQVKQSIIETFAENDDMGKIELVDLYLIHKGDNEYTGGADVIIENPVADLLNNAFENDYLELKKNIEYSYKVDVVYDGENFTWEFRE